MPLAHGAPDLGGAGVAVNVGADVGGVDMAVGGAGVSVGVGSVGAAIAPIFSACVVVGAGAGVNVGGVGMGVAVGAGVSVAIGAIVVAAAGVGVAIGAGVGEHAVSSEIATTDMMASRARAVVILVARLGIALPFTFSSPA